MRYENLGPVANPDGSPTDLTRAMLEGTGRDPEAFALSAAEGDVLTRQALEAEDEDEGFPYYTMPLEPLNVRDLHESAARDELVGIVSIADGGIIAYGLGTEHADLIMAALTDRHDANKEYDARVTTVCDILWDFGVYTKDNHPLAAAIVAALVGENPSEQVTRCSVCGYEDGEHNPETHRAESYAAQYEPYERAMEPQEDW